MDQEEPLVASIFSPYAYVTGAIKGKKISLAGWDHYTKMSGYQAKVVEVYGSPKAEMKK